MISLASCSSMDFSYIKLPSANWLSLSRSIKSGKIDEVSSALVSIDSKEKFSKHLGEFLTEAIELGHDDIAELLIKNGADVNVHYADYNSPIFNAVLLSSKFYCKSPALMAVRLGNTKILNILYSNGLLIEDLYLMLHMASRGIYRNLSLTCIPCSYCLHLSMIGEAMKFKRYDIMDFLLSKGLGYPYGIDVFGNTLLMLAIEEGDQKIIQKLLPFYYPLYNINFINNTGWTALSTAIYKGNIELAKTMLNNVGSLKDQDKEVFQLDSDSGRVYPVQPLILASFYDNTDLINMLINKDFDPDIKGDLSLNFALDTVVKTFTSFRFYKVDWVDSTITSYYSEKKPEIEDSVVVLKSITPLIAASIAGNINSIKLLIKEGVDINSYDSEGYNSLMFAIMQNKIDIVKYLIDNNIDINFQKMKYRRFKLLNKDAIYPTALMIAVRYSNLEAVDLLLSKSADINLQDSLGRTALIYAITEDKLEDEVGIKILKLLLDHGANKNIKDSNNQTAMDLAKKLKHDKAINMLQSK
ncbi:hypothetical protein IHI24_000068 [Rickettsia endosymbiont of Cardiosporidium cionae]|nr:hypothetical protein IHI24_000068 [Rickettsia endosymbiont of Cardiosporidium cionae]